MMLMAIWIAMGATSLVFFHFNRDAKLKRKVFPWFISGIGILFVGFIVLEGFPAMALYVAVPGIIAVSLINVLVTKFCDRCGRTITNPDWFSPMRYCPKCGADLRKELL